MNNKDYGKKASEVDDFFNKVILDSCTMYPATYPAPKPSEETGSPSEAGSSPNYCILNSGKSVQLSTSGSDDISAFGDPSSKKRSGLSFESSSVQSSSSSTSSYTGIRKNSNIKSYKDNIITVHLPNLDKLELSYLSRTFKKARSDQELVNDANDEILWDFTDVIKKNPSMINNMMEMMVQEYYVKRNAIPNEIERKYHSFSMLQPVYETGFNFVVFPGSHKWSRKQVRFHTAYGVRLIVPNYCGVLFLDDLLHGGGRVRYGVTGSIIPDPRIFMYIQQVGLNPYNSSTEKADSEEDKHARTRSDCSMCPVGNYTPKPNQMCYNLVGNEFVCSECDSMDPVCEKIIDVEACFGEDILKKKKVGSILFGDLESFGFVVFRSKSPSQSFCTSLKEELSHMKGDQVGDQPNRRVLYSYKTNDSASLKRTDIDENVSVFTKAVFKKLVSTVLDYAEFRMLKPNLIWNNGLIESDQLPHFDYPDEGEFSM